MINHKKNHDLSTTFRSKLVKWPAHTRPRHGGTSSRSHHGGQPASSTWTGPKSVRSWWNGETVKPQLVGGWPRPKWWFNGIWWWFFWGSNGILGGFFWGSNGNLFMDIWLVVSTYLALWKMMEWKSMGRMTSQIWIDMMEHKIHVCFVWLVSRFYIILPLARDFLQYFWSWPRLAQLWGWNSSIFIGQTCVSGWKKHCWKHTVSHFTGMEKLDVYKIKTLDRRSWITHKFQTL